MFGPQRHRNLVAAMPLSSGDLVVDLGCGGGATLRELAALPTSLRLVGLDRLLPVGLPAGVQGVAADLTGPLPFADGTVDGVVCHNVLEDLADPAAFLVEVARALRPGGFLLLGHTDFDTLVFSSSDLALTRRLVHRFCDEVQPWMSAAEGAIGRRLLALGRRSPLRVVETHVWVGHHTTLEPDGPADVAASLLVESGRRDPELAGLVDAWRADLEAQARRGELLYSVNDYAVLLTRSDDRPARSTLGDRTA